MNCNFFIAVSVFNFFITVKSLKIRPNSDQAGVQAERLLQELPVNLSERLQQVQSVRFVICCDHGSPKHTKLLKHSIWMNLRG